MQTKIIGPKEKFYYLAKHMRPCEFDQIRHLVKELRVLSPSLPPSHSNDHYYFTVFNSIRKKGIT